MFIPSLVYADRKLPEKLI